MTSQVCKVCSQFKHQHGADWAHEFEPTEEGQWVYAIDASTPHVQEWVVAPDGSLYSIHEVSAVLNALTPSATTGQE